jgi:hypothetical protein
MLDNAMLKPQKNGDATPPGERVVGSEQSGLPTNLYLHLGGIACAGQCQRWVRDR